MSLIAKQGVYSHEEKIIGGGEECIAAPSGQQMQLPPPPKKLRYFDGAHRHHLGERFFCPVYCCGYCDQRYCCDDETKRISQLSFGMCVDVCHVKNATSSSKQKVVERPCPLDKPFCCGSCQKRECCGTLGLRLDQDDCDEEKIEPK